MSEVGWQRTHPNRIRHFPSEAQIELIGVEDPNLVSATIGLELIWDAVSISPVGPTEQRTVTIRGVEWQVVEFGWSNFAVNPISGVMQSRVQALRVGTIVVMAHGFWGTSTPLEIVSDIDAACATVEIVHDPMGVRIALPAFQIRSF